MPLPSSVKLTEVRDATSGADVLIEFDVAAAEVPWAFFAVTANVYEVPGCRPSKLNVPPTA